MKLSILLVLSTLVFSAALAQTDSASSDKQPTAVWIFIQPSRDMSYVSDNFGGLNGSHFVPDAAPFKSSDFDQLLRKSVSERMHNVAGITMSPNEADVVFSSADYNCAGATCNFKINIANGAIAKRGFEYWNFPKPSGGTMAAASFDKNQPGFLKKAAESLADQMEAYRLEAEKRRAMQERYQVQAERRKEARDLRHRQYIARETAARQQKAQYNEATMRQLQQQSFHSDQTSKAVDVSDAAAFQIFLGLRPANLISRCGQPISDNFEKRLQPVRSAVRTLVYSTSSYGRATVHFITLSPTPTPDNLSFSELLVQIAGSTRSLIPAEPNDRKLILQILPCLVPTSSAAIKSRRPNIEPSSSSVSATTQQPDELSNCPAGSQHPNPESESSNGRQQLAFRAVCVLNSATIKTYSDCPTRFSFDRAGRCIAELDKCPAGWEDHWDDDGRTMWCVQK